MPQENVEIVRQALALYNGRDFEALQTLNHPDVELDWSASRAVYAGVYRGWPDVLRFYKNVFVEVFEEAVIEPERFIESGDSVIVPNSAEVRGRDGIHAVARSALVFEVRFEVRGGRIARIRLYQETREALEAFGFSE
jgi:ketosteroid isomerase-like protein